MRRMVAGALSCAVLFSCLSIVPDAASAVSSQVVAAGQISWRVPALQAANARVANVITTTAASTIITVENAEAPSSYPFDVTLSVGQVLIPQPDGSVDVVSRVGGAWFASGRFEAPWAHDASGRVLPTHYDVTGNRMTQVIETTNAQYPITADPKYTWGWVSGTVYFNKSETLKIAAVAGFIGTIAGKAPGIWSTLLMFGSGFYVLEAGWAIADSKCLKIKSNGFPYEYTGGYCT